MKGEEGGIDQRREGGMEEYNQIRNESEAVNIENKGKSTL